MPTEADVAPWIHRPAARDWRCDPADSGAIEFHRGLPGYSPTPLVELPSLAEELGVSSLHVKDESSRFGLPSFKILGVAWAVYGALSERLGGPIEPATIERMRDAVAALPPIELVTATDGNHGRALAHMASLLGMSSRVFVPGHLRPAAIAAIEREGATVSRVSGSYDAAVRQAAVMAGESLGAILIQDTAWPGYEQIPGWTVEGYSTLFVEADAQLRAAGVESPSLVAVPVGVGSLLQSALAHYRREGRAESSSVLSVEPDTAAGVLASVREGRLTTVTTGVTIMSGLNCEMPSSLAWPYIEQGLDAAVSVKDVDARRAMVDLGNLGIPAGPSGAASLAGVRAVLGVAARSAEAGITPESTLLLICTEGIASGAA